MTEMPTNTHLENGESPPELAEETRELIKAMLIQKLQVNTLGLEKESQLWEGNAWSAFRYEKYYGVPISEDSQSLAIARQDDDGSYSVLLPGDESYDSEINKMSNITLSEQIANPLSGNMIRALREWKGLNGMVALEARLKSSTKREIGNLLPLLAILNRLDEENHPALINVKGQKRPVEFLELKRLVHEVKKHLKKTEKPEVLMGQHEWNQTEGGEEVGKE